MERSYADVAGRTASMALAFALASAALSIDPAHAQDTTAAPAAPAPASPPALKALVGGALIDGFGGPPLQDSVILIEGDRIAAVGTVETLPVPAGAEVISTEGMSVLPGLWDAHVHLMINGHADYEHWHVKYRQQFETVIMPASAEQLLLAGVTAVRDLGAPLEDILRVRDRIAKGEIPGPRLFVSGPFIQKAPYQDWNAEYRWGVNGPAEARAKVAKLAQAGVDFIKLIDQDQMTLEEARAVVDEAHKRGLKVIGHSHRPAEILIGLEVGLDNFEHTGLAASPEYPPDVMAALHKRTGDMASGFLYWTPTISGLFTYGRKTANPEVLDSPGWHRGLPPEIVEDIARSIRFPERIRYFQFTPDRAPTLKRKFEQLRGAGVKLLVGTDSGIPLTFHNQSTWEELAIWVRELGVPPMEAIRSATYWPARFLDKDGDLGSVTPGRYADIIAVKGDVLTHIELLADVDIVIKGGVRYK